MSEFREFVRLVRDAGLDKADEAASFIWWAEQRDAKQNLSMDEICSYFEQARLPQPNRTRLARDLRKSKYVTCNKGGKYKLTRDGIEKWNDLFSAFVPHETADELVSRVDVAACPYITQGDVTDAKRMAGLYVSLFCLENSVRRHVGRVLHAGLGANWWDSAASASMKRKEADRRTNEQQNRWVPSRADSGPLYSLDWPDLVTLIRKHEHLFKDSLPDINFLHRFSDLGNLRNVVAHNGVISEPMQFQRVELAFHDWVKQISSGAA